MRKPGSSTFERCLREIDPDIAGHGNSPQAFATHASIAASEIEHVQGLWDLARDRMDALGHLAMLHEIEVDHLVVQRPVCEDFSPLGDIATHDGSTSCGISRSNS